MCAILSEMHITWHPQRDEDGRSFKNYKRNVISIGEESIAKCKRTLAAYRARLSGCVARNFSGLYQKARGGAMLDILRE